MILKEALLAAILKQREELKAEPSGVARTASCDVDMEVPHAIVVTGVRRCGKSTLLRQLLSPEFAYCDFEDPNLIDFTVRDFGKLEEVFHETVPGFKGSFFDEIQNVEEWERYVNGAGHKFVLTGSNASLLSRELGTRLTGRHLDVELFPFSYEEALSFWSEPPSVSSYERYCQEGGFPEFLRHGRRQILQELFRDIVLRDIVVRNQIRDSRTLQELALYLLSNVGKEYSCLQLAKTFDVGSPNTIKSYISHMEDCYLVFTVPRFSFSLKKQRRNPRKVYAVDVGLCRANSLAFSENLGSLLENQVFLELRRRSVDLFYFKEEGECDFVVKDRSKIVAVIQVCYTLDDSNLEREVRGVKEAMVATGCGKGIIITMRQEDEVDGVPVVPAWRWCSQASFLDSPPASR